jgi:hypothetical protein
LRQSEDLAAAGKIRKVLVHEISRIARRNSVSHSSSRRSSITASRFTGTPKESKRYCRMGNATRPPVSCSPCSLRWPEANTNC